MALLWVALWLVGSAVAFSSSGPTLADNTNESADDGDEAGSAEAEEEAYRFEWREVGAVQVANSFLERLGRQEYQGAYESGSNLLRETRTLEAFTAHVEEDGLNQFQSVEWENGVPAKDGVRLSGIMTTTEGESFPIYLNLLGDEGVVGPDRNTEWNTETSFTVLDVQDNTGLFARIGSGNTQGLDLFIALLALILLGALFFMIARYVKGLRGSPRELYLMFFTKLTEYSAYGAASYCFVLYLSKDVGLGDSGATAYYTVFSLVMTVTVMVVGAVCDTIGIKKSLLIGAFMLLTARFFMPLTNDLVLTSILGFLPFALGVAITGPVLKVGIKMFTTVKTATLGFGLFYTLMNVGFAIGGWMFDYIRTEFGDGGSATLPIFGVELSTYQIILGVGFFINIPDLIAILWMREGAEMTENGMVIHKKAEVDHDELTSMLSNTMEERRGAMTRELLIGLAYAAVVGLLAFGVNSLGWTNKWAWAFVVFLGLGAAGMLTYALLSMAGTAVAGFDRVMNAVRESTQETGRRLKENFSERQFWIYLFMLAVLVFVRLTFFIFHVMFPTYGIRVFGEGAMVGSIFGVLNPVMIVFLVPLISVLTMKVRSYTMLLIGTLVSAGAVFLCFMPESIAIFLSDTWFGELIFDRWLEVPVGQRDPFYISLIIFIAVFTVGEAIWSPRLMQFSAEIAPRGKEGAYIALAILPYFVGKALAGGMSGFLLTTYTPETATSYPDHELVWLWIGGMAMISPIGLVIFRKLFTQVETQALEEAKLVAAEAAAGSEEPRAEGD
jgi:MFS family permease